MFHLLFSIREHKSYHTYKDFASSNNKANRVPVDTSTAAVVSESDNVKGNKNADVVLFKYSDFECPACAAYHPLINEVSAKYGDQIAYAHRHFPLYFHSNAKPAAWAAEAAGKQGKYFEMADLIFANQEVWRGKAANVSLFYEYAEELDLDMDQFKTDAVSAETKTKVDADLNLGTALGVNSTPTFYINDQKIDRAPNTLEGFSELIDAALAAAENTTTETEEVASSTTDTETEVESEDTASSTEE